MARKDLGLLALIAIMFAGSKGIDRALKDAGNSLGKQNYPHSNKNYHQAKNIRANQNYLHSHRPLFYRKVI